MTAPTGEAVAALARGRNATRGAELPGKAKPQAFR